MFGILRSRSSKPRQPSSAELPSYFSVIDPGSTNFRVLIVEVVAGHATVWGWAEQSGWADGDLDVQDLFSICSKVQAEAEEMARDRAERWFLPDQMIVGLPASQLVGRAWPVSQIRSHPERPLEEREVEALLSRALRLTVNRLLSIVQPEGPYDMDDPDWLLIDAAPVALAVDGRGVTDLIGFRGRELHAMVFAALGRIEAITAWQWVAERLEFSALTLTAAPMALAAAQSGSQGILVDVGGRATDLIWWRNGRPVAIDSLPLGGGALTSLLARKWNLSDTRAGRLKHAYAAGKLEEEAGAQVLEVMSPVLRDWLDGTELALDRLSEGWDDPLPQRMDLLGGGGALPEFEDALSTLAWSKRLDFERYPEVSRLRPTDVPGVVNRTDLGRGAGDVSALALAAWAARQTQEPDRSSKILSELCHE